MTSVVDPKVGRSSGDHQVTWTTFCERFVVGRLPLAFLRVALRLDGALRLRLRGHVARELERRRTESRFGVAVEPFREQVLHQIDVAVSGCWMEQGFARRCLDRVEPTSHRREVAQDVELAALGRRVQRGAAAKSFVGLLAVRFRAGLDEDANDRGVRTLCGDDERCEATRLRLARGNRRGGELRVSCGDRGEQRSLKRLLRNGFCPELRSR